MKNIELPRKVIIGEGVINKIKDVCDDLGLVGNPLVISDVKTKEIAGSEVADSLNSGIRVLKDSENIEEITISDNVGFVLGVGGGRVIDAAKLLAFKSRVPFLSVPTAVSHDGIASPLVSLNKGERVSVEARSPVGVIADTRIIRRAPHRLLAAGCGDAISNYTAVLDWKLAHKEKGEYFGDYASALSDMSAQIVMENALKIRDDVSIVVEASISSGVAIGIAGSSRPCSGSEHLFSHVLDVICPKPALHGEQCGVGTIMMAYLHDADWERVRDSLKEVGTPVNAKELGIDEDYIIEALTTAHKIRDRYTILRDGLCYDDAYELAKSTEVI
ncbi:MAG: NAD(P)-dependent glycerol-1-phosphate dehydrogenase [Candidatus Altiarchaeales archaeon WOR_SM1_86-2]|nr:MAG: NAD(P)-dependent glycerol-1-phosphate dehydrogenase [Candidatus Altiarchaeales archaeon WOR_SM1_86-2]ODS36107.1 MAG: NAD(P)-dependent glycerol-1-phosphate dehydrogenase [Candidatus Altiarchaeales archaeon WOR_SM1_79]